MTVMLSKKSIERHYEDCCEAYVKYVLDKPDFKEPTDDQIIAITCSVLAVILNKDRDAVDKDIKRYKKRLETQAATNA